MAPVLSRSLSTASLASLPSSSPFTLRNPNRALNLRTAFVPQSGLRKGFACSGLKWRLERQNRQVTVRCDAAVAEKEVADAPGEEFEYQAEVGLYLFLLKFGSFGFWLNWVLKFIINCCSVCYKFPDFCIICGGDALALSYGAFLIVWTENDKNDCLLFCFCLWVLNWKLRTLKPIAGQSVNGFDSSQSIQPQGGVP